MHDDSEFRLRIDTNTYFDCKTQEPYGKRVAAVTNGLWTIVLRPFNDILPCVRTRTRKNKRGMAYNIPVFKRRFFKNTFYICIGTCVCVRARGRAVRAEEFREFHRARRRSVKVFMFVAGRRKKISLVCRQIHRIRSFLNVRSQSDICPYNSGKWHIANGASGDHGTTSITTRIRVRFYVVLHHLVH